MLELIKDPDPILKQVSVKVDLSKESIKDLLLLIGNMQQVMNNNCGCGLSAVQVGVLKRIIVWSIPLVPVTPPIEWAEDFSYLINPEIVSSSMAKLRVVEGCLSMTHEATKTRANEIAVKGFRIAQNGKPYSVRWNLVGLESVIVQHEIDHLNGVTI